MVGRFRAAKCPKCTPECLSRPKGVARTLIWFRLSRMRSSSSVVRLEMFTKRVLAI